MGKELSKISPYVRIGSFKKGLFKKLVAESQVYERIFDIIIFLQIKRITLKNLPVAESQVYVRIFNIFFANKKNINFGKFTCG